MDCTTHRLQHGFWYSARPWSVQALDSLLFLGACCMLVGSDDSAVDHECFQISIHAEHAHDGQPTTTFTPLVKARVRGVPVPQLSRQVASGCTGSRNPQNGFNNSAIVCSGNPAVACLAGQHLHLGPYYVTEKLSCHCYSNHSKMIINTLLRKNRAFQDLDSAKFSQSFRWFFGQPQY
jgi:hypothetical protein